MRTLMYQLRRRVPRCVGNWAMGCRPLRRRLKQVVVRDGSRVLMPLEGGLVLEIHPTRHRDLWFYEPERGLRQVLKGVIYEGDTVWDIGANVGYYTVLFAHWVGPAGHVVAFEPDADNFGFLERNCEINDLTERVTLENAAVSSISGTGVLAGTDSFTHKLVEGPRPASPGHQTVRTVCLDDYMRQSSTQPPCLVKMDVEGHEGKGLEGMKETLFAHEVCLSYLFSVAK